MIQNPLGQLLFRRCLAQQLFQLIRLHRQRVVFPLALRGLPVKHPRQDGTELGQVPVDAAEAVHDASLLVGQDQVGTASHGLQNQMTGHLVPHLVGGLQFHIHHPLHRRLPQSDDSCAGQVFPQEHTEHGRIGRVLPAAFGELEPGMGGVGGEQQLAVALIAPEEHHNFIPGRLKDLIHTSALHSRTALLHNAR